MTRHTVRSEATQERILSTAERLFAEHGVYGVSNRQIGEAAGQGNTAAVGYHFGTKQDLVRAIVRRHAGEIERIRARMVADTAGSRNVRDWVACMVHPTAEHLAELGSPTWFARFNAQVLTDPALRDMLTEESITSPSLVEALDCLNRCLPSLPPDVRAERSDMTRQLLVHMVAERERALSEGGPTPRSNWTHASAGLTDAITAVWVAPVSDPDS